MSRPVAVLSLLACLVCVASQNTWTSRARASTPAPRRVGLAIELASRDLVGDELATTIEHHVAAVLRAGEFLPSRSPDDPVVVVQVWPAREIGYEIIVRIERGRTLLNGTDERMHCYACSEVELVGRIEQQVRHVAAKLRGESTFVVAPARRPVQASHVPGTGRRPALSWPGPDVRGRCDYVRRSARDAGNLFLWRVVLDRISEASCWEGAEDRLVLAMQANAELGRLSECISLGTSPRNKDPSVVKMVAYCRRLKEARK